MRCARVVPLVERFVDGALDGGTALRVTEHAQTCERCSGRIEAARALVAGFAAAPKVAAPDGFFQKVMDDVYRQALGKGHIPAVEARSAARVASAARFYRRLGLSLVITAGILGASLLIPGVSYISLVGSGGRTGIPRETSIVVKSALDGAGSAVRGILGEPPRGGDDR